MKILYFLIVGLVLSIGLKAQVAKTVDLISGNLSDLITDEEKSTITSLTLIGTVDARDFKLIRDQMPLLETLDLSGVTIKAYSGTEGSNENITDYNENEVPSQAFDNSFDERKSRLVTVVLPESVTVIGSEAFSQCRALKDFQIPPSVTAINYYAFAGCTGITAMIIPSSVTTIGIQVFRGCKSLKKIELPGSITDIDNAAFEACDSLLSVTLPSSLTTINSRLFYSCIGLKTVEMGQAVTTIADEAFFYCTSLESLTIPATVTRIGYNAFTYCSSLATLYAYPVNPPDLGESGVVFSNVDLDQCILYVPPGSRDLYAAASKWKDFQHIAEMGEFSLEATSVILQKENSQATVKLHSSLPWTASSDQQWLSVSPQSGDGDHDLILTAEANPKDTARTALVTIYAQGADTLTITVAQHGIAVGGNELATTARVKYYPNPFTDQMGIEIENPSLKEVSVEVFSMNGQKIRTLARAQKRAKISLVWDGKNEQGNQVFSGVYLLKIGEQTMKVMKR